MANASNALNALSKWIDEANQHRCDEAQLWGRVSKITEENGEVIEAIIGYLGANPRKGKTHELLQVREELFDVAITALGAICHIDDNGSDVINELALRIERVARRAGVDYA